MATAQAAKPADKKMIRVTQVKSTTGFNKNQAEVIRSLGLRRIRHSIEVPDTASIRTCMASSALVRPSAL